MNHDDKCATPCPECSLDLLGGKTVLCFRGSKEQWQEG